MRACVRVVLWCMNFGLHGCVCVGDAAKVGCEGSSYGNQLRRGDVCLPVVCLFVCSRESDVSLRRLSIAERAET